MLLLRPHYLALIVIVLLVSSVQCYCILIHNVTDWKMIARLYLNNSTSRVELFLEACLLSFLLSIYHQLKSTLDNNIKSCHQIV